MMSPQLGRGKSRSFRKRAQFRPHDALVHTFGKRALREAAVGAGQHILAAHDFGKADKSLRHQFRMLDDVGGMADQAGNELSVREAASRSATPSIRARGAGSPVQRCNGRP